MGSGDAEDEGFDHDESDAVACEEPRRAATALECRGDAALESASENVRDEDDGSVECSGVLEEHTHVWLEPSVGEENDGVVGLEGEELVGERRPGVYERAARLSDPLRHELSVRGEMCGRPDTSPDHPVPAGEDRDRVLEGLRRDVP